MDYDTFMTIYEEQFPEATVTQARKAYQKHCETHGKQRGSLNTVISFVLYCKRERAVGVLLVGAEPRRRDITGFVEQ